MKTKYKQMKGLILSLIFILLSFCTVFAQTEDAQFGGALAFCVLKDYHQPGINLRAVIPAREQISLSPDFSYFLTEKEYYSKMSVWDLNFNIRYDVGSVYISGGMNLTVAHAKSNFVNTITVKDTRMGAGLNMGAGYSLSLTEQSDFFLEARYSLVTNSLSHIVLYAGMLFALP
jgi:hypothetical protein